MKVAIVSAVWQRPEVFEMFAKGINHLVSRCKDIEFTVIISGSEGDKSKYMVEKHGFIYIEMPNDPLAVKMNATVIRAKEYDVDYILCLGSDDIISPELMKIYKHQMRSEIDYIGVTDFYFYDTVSGKSAYWGGYREMYRKSHTCGAGRILSKHLLNQWNWQPWDVKHNKILDTSIQEKLNRTPHSSFAFSLKDVGLFALDIKSSTNMTKFELWDNTEYIDTSIIKNNFPYLFK